MFPYIRAFAALIAIGVYSPLQAQFSAEYGTGGAQRLRGHVQGEGYGLLTAEVIELERHYPIERVLVAPSGVFEFRSALKGTLELRILNDVGEVIKREWISVTDLSVPVVIQLPVLRKERPASGFATPYTMRHKVPAKASKEFRKAEEAHRRSDLSKAVAHLRKAVEIDPGFVEAQNNLGVRLVQSGSLQEAIPFFRRATEIDPDNPLPRQNLTNVLGRLKKPQVRARTPPAAEESSHPASRK